VAATNSKAVNMSVQTTTTIPKSVVIKESPRTKLCLHCKKELEYNDTYCQHCGTRQDCSQNNSRFVVTCKKCSRQQEEALVDATCTKFCTFCGSNLLEWKCK
jgi:hypothetical protein